MQRKRKKGRERERPRTFECRLDGFKRIYNVMLMCVLLLVNFSPHKSSTRGEKREGVSESACMRASLIEDRAGDREKGRGTWRGHEGPQWLQERKYVCA